MVELKSGTTFAPEWAVGARRAAGYLGPEAAPEPLVVYGGQDAFSVSGVRAMPWRDIGMA